MSINEFFRKGREEPLEKKPKEPEKEPKEQQPVIHIVQPGESLSKIAKKHYGDAMKWRLIYERNTDKIKNPDMIYPEQELIIPPIERPLI